MTPTTPTSGNVEITASLSATGTPDNTKFLRGDNVWARANETYTFAQASASVVWTVQHDSRQVSFCNYGFVHRTERLWRYSIHR